MFDLAVWGEVIDEGQLEQLRAQVETALDEEGSEKPDDFTVWPANTEAIAVFQRCKWDREPAGNRLLFTGIAADEIRTVMDLLQIPRDRAAAVFDQVRYAASVVLPRLNGD